MIGSLLNGIKDLVYPPICINCRQQRIPTNPFTGLCPRCTGRIKLNAPPFCLKCNRHLRETCPAPLCRNCRERPLSFDFAYGACAYTPYLRGLIHQFKFHHKTYLKHVFVQRMMDYVRLHNLDIDQFHAVVPMPLSAARQRERGYNQSLLLAELIACRIDKPLWPKALRKTRHTVNQSALSRKERFTNVKGAFRINPSRRFRGANILIIDDLLTTGATASSAAEAVKAAQAKSVAVLTLAIA
ncbi:MAG: ComF family protein [Candidatus Omnitrophica bacterium]|nr:ComF family protein [Candidatus Omnitrophota bacterium]